MSKMIFGCGYLGSRVARRWLDAGEQVFVVTRSAERAARFAAEGFRPIVADVLQPQSLAGLPTVDTVLFAIGHGRDASATVHDVFVGGLNAVLNVLPSPTGKFIYVSSTGVYGQSDGQWVDELSPCEPKPTGGRACLAAEQLLAAHALGSWTIVLRMAGLYGPGRIPKVESIRAGRPIAVPQRGYLNLIHVDDAASTVVAADQRACPPRTYVVSDGNPVLRRAYYEELARLFDAPSPQFESPPDDAPSALRAASDKRANSARMTAELGMKLAYPSYREGLAAIVTADCEAKIGDS